MHSTVLLLGLLSTPAYSRYLGLSRRSDPTFVDSTNHDVLKRADPYFYDGDFGENEDGDDKKELLRDGVKDVYELVSNALNHWQDDIFNSWFPGKPDQIKNVLRAIVPSPEDHPNVGGDDLRLFEITPEDFLEGAGENDLCELGVDAYTANRDRQRSGDETEEFALVHFCPKAFDPEQPMRLSDLDCEEDFKFDNGRYRVTNMMDSLGATILHEMIHFNAIGGKTGLTRICVVFDTRFDCKDRRGAIVSDIAGEDTVADVGDPYASYILRTVSDEHDMCFINADNYVWLVLELYWTHKCREKLEEQGGRFDRPQAPEDD